MDYGTVSMISTIQEKTTPWRIVFLLLGAGVASSFQIGKVPGVLPMLMTDLGLTLFLASWVIAILNGIGAVAGVFMGGFADRVGYRRLIIVGLSLIAVGCLVGGFTSHVAVFFISRLIEGVGFFFTVLSGPSLITRIADPRDLRLILGLWGAYMPSGITIMLFISPFVVDRIGWRGLWLLNGLICLIFLVAFAGSTTHLSQGRKTSSKPSMNVSRNIKTVFMTPGPVLLAICFLCYAGQWMALMNFLPTFFIAEVGMRKGGAAIWTALAVLVNIPGNISGGFLSQKNVPRWMVLSLVFIFITLFTIGIYSQKTPLTIRLLLCLGFSFIGGHVPGTLMAAVPFHSPGKEYIGATNGLITQGSNIGTLLMAPALAAIVSLFGGWHGAPLIFGVAGLIGLSASLAIGKLERNRGPDVFNATRA
jgi:MFS family permease